MQRVERHSRTRRRIRLLALPSLVMTSLSTFGIYYAAVGVRGSDFKRWNDIARSMPIGTVPAEIERDFNQRFLPSAAARTLLFGVDARAVRMISPERITASDGTVFVREDIDVCHSVPFLARADGRPRDAINVLAALAMRLQTRGIHLIVVPVPSKASIYPDRLHPAYDVARGPDLNAGHREWVAALEAKGLEVFDPSQLLWDCRGETMYFKTDTHWTPRAMEVTAAALAERCRALAPGSAGVQQFESRVMQRVLKGDSPDENDPAGADLVTDYHQILDGGESASFGDEAQILVIGDSNVHLLQEQSGGLAHLLARDVQQGVQSVGLWGVRAPAMVREVEADAQRLKQKKVVVLVFAIRKLLTDDWLPARLP